MENDIRLSSHNGLSDAGPASVFNAPKSASMLLSAPVCTTAPVVIHLQALYASSPSMQDAVMDVVFVNAFRTPEDEATTAPEDLHLCASSVNHDPKAPVILANNALRASETDVVPIYATTERALLIDVAPDSTPSDILSSEVPRMYAPEFSTPNGKLQIVHSTAKISSNIKVPAVLKFLKRYQQIWIKEAQRLCYMMCKGNTFNLCCKHSC